MDQRERSIKLNYFVNGLFAKEISFWLLKEVINIERKLWTFTDIALLSLRHGR